MPTGEAAVAPDTPRTSLLLPRVILFVAVLAAYANTFSVPFVFDDVAAITQNPSIEKFSTAFSPPPDLSVTGRPLVNLSLAINHAISGEAVWSYHVLNLALHVASALLLFGLVRRTLSGLTLSDPVAPAFATTLLWAVHPLQTGAVTYVMQRSELLVSLCCLLTLYCFVRSRNCSARARWEVASVLACALGMTAKEVMATAPLLVLLYDRTFVAGSFRAALGARRAYYAAISATWLVLAWLVLGTAGRGASAGFSAGVVWSDYGLRQVYAVALYLRLIVCPFPLVFDYGDTLVTAPAIFLASGLIVTALVIASLIALRVRPVLGFLAVAFLLLVAPSSSVVPIATQTIAEHRVYLALAAPVALLVLGLFRWLPGRALPVCLIFALGLSALTFARNADYRSPVTLWRDTVVRRPNNPRAHYNLAASLAAAGNNTAAMTELDATLRLDPGHAPAHHKLGALLFGSGRASEALPHLEAAVRLAPTAGAHYDLGNALVQLNRIADAVAHYTESIRLDPDHAIVHYNLGTALAQLGRYPEALAQFDAAVRLDPQDASARGNATRIREYLRVSPR